MVACSGSFNKDGESFCPDVNVIESQTNWYKLTQEYVNHCHTLNRFECYKKILSYSHLLRENEALIKSETLRDAPECARKVIYGTDYSNVELENEISKNVRLSFLEK